MGLSFLDETGKGHRGKEAIGTFSTVLQGRRPTDLIAVYRVDGAGLITSMAAHWEVERTMATVRPV